MRITIPALIILSLLVLPLPANVQAQNPSTQLTYPFTDTVTNCNGDVVQLTGEGHVVARFAFDNTGLHLVDITNTMGPLRGVALVSGTVYQANETVSTVINDNGQTPQVELTMVVSEVLISQGSAPNFVVHTTLHFTVSSNGLPTAQVLNTKADC
jgi:uncharacterized membrane protein (UPF0136 family)